MIVTNIDSRLITKMIDKEYREKLKLGTVLKVETGGFYRLEVQSDRLNNRSLVVLH